MGCARPRPSAPSAGSSEFRFLVVNDLHCGGPECAPFLAGLVRQMRAHENIAFCLVVGDLADNGQPASLEAVRDAFGGLGVPIHPVPGNHDCDIGLDARIYSEAFPDRLNYTFMHGGWQFVGFDSTDGNAWHDTRLGAAALVFLERTAAHLDPAAPTIVFTHFPLAPEVHMAPVNTAEALDRLAPLNVRAAFCGHFHGRTQHRHGQTVLLTNTCCSRVRDNHDGTLAEGYLLCSAYPDGTIESAFVEYAPARPAVAPAPIHPPTRQPASS